MKILVAGADGQLARSLVEAAASEPTTGRTIQVLALGRPALDLRDRNSMARAIGHAEPDLVINAAAYTAVDRAEAEPEAAAAVNAEGAGALAEAAAQRELPIVHISTDYVFDGLQDGPYRETDTPNPTTAYGRSKLAGERNVAGANPQHLILRTAWVYSPFGHNFVKTMLRLARERPELRVVADQRGSPTYAADLATTALAMASRLRDMAAGSRKADAPWGIYHVAGTGTATWHGLAECVIGTAAARSGVRPTVVHPITTAEFPTPAQRPANSQLDCSKLARVFGLSLPHWTDGVSRCLTRILAEPESARPR